MATGLILVDESIAEDVAAQLAAKARRLPSGDPSSGQVALGPIIGDAQVKTIQAIVDDAVAKGATLLAGGTCDRRFYAATVLSGVKPGMRAFDEEIFGPVACLIPFTDEADAIAQANDIQYGLSSYVWSENLGRAHRIAAAIEAGMCFVNSQNVRDLRQPFGGTKASGTGREGGTWSYEVFLEAKNVCVSMGSHHIPHWGA